MRRVVVTGLGAVTPVGGDVPSTWESLIAGRHGITPVTRFNPEGYKATLAAEVKDFDPLKTMERGEARKMDLFAQYAMAAAVEAMTDSGLQGTIEDSRFGVYVGSGIGGIQTFAAEMEKLLEKGPRRISPFFIPMLIANMAAGLIAIRFNAKGPCLPVTTACATSTNAVGEAFRAIRYGYADAILAGGSEAAICPIGFAGFANMTALHVGTDPDRASIPFDAERSGFVMGEGAGMLVLEEYQHAKDRGATIYAELCGYGCTCDAYHMTAPSPDAEGGAAAMRLAMEEAGLSGGDGLYINAHGTSTPANDGAETLAIKKALGEKEAHRSLISSTKSMTGHMLGAAGAVEAMVCALALRDGIVPPTVGLQTPAPDCDLDYVPGQARRANLRAALSMSLGFGGHNACVALKKEEA